MWKVHNKPSNNGQCWHGSTAVIGHMSLALPLWFCRKIENTYILLQDVTEVCKCVCRTYALWERNMLGLHKNACIVCRWKIAFKFLGVNSAIVFRHVHYAQLSYTLHSSCAQWFYIKKQDSIWFCLLIWFFPRFPRKMLSNSCCDRCIRIFSIQWIFGYKFKNKCMPPCFQTCLLCTAVIHSLCPVILEQIGLYIILGHAGKFFFPYSVFYGMVFSTVWLGTAKEDVEELLL